MKRKWTVVVSCILLVFSLLPTAALAYDYDSKTYNEDEYRKLVVFLETESDESGVKNGFQISSGYDPLNPATWTGVEWTGPTDNLRVSKISWVDKKLTGLLDLSSFTSLERLDCGDNALTGLNLTGDTALTLLGCRENRLSSLDLSTNAALKKIACSHNELSKLVTTENKALDYIDCDKNHISELHFDTNTSLESISCSYNALTSLDVSMCPKLSSLMCIQNALTTLNVTGCTVLNLLGCGHNQLSMLDLSANNALSKLGCESNPITQLKMINVTQLEELICSDTLLSELNVNANPKLALFECSNNALTSLDLSGNSNLAIFDCSGNDITSLDLSKNPRLFSFKCGGNALTSLDLKNNKSLQTLNCADNPLRCINADIAGAAVNLYANGTGYISLNVSDLKDFYAQAVPVGAAAFVNWTDKSSLQVSETLKYDMKIGQTYDLTSNFLTLTVSPTDGKIYTNQKAIITPSVAGGTWSFDSSLLSRDGNVFTGLKAGTARVIYTLGQASAFADITVSQTLALTVSPANCRIYTGGRIIITPNIQGGIWSFDGSLLSRDGITFTGLKEGTARVTYTAEGQSAYADVIVSKALLPLTGQDYTGIFVLLGLTLISIGASTVLMLKRKNPDNK